MPSESPLVTSGRWLRAGVFSMAMVVLAASAHLMAGGHLPEVGSMVAAGLLVGCLTYPVTRSGRGVGAIIAVTVAAQATLHVAFAVSMPGPTPTQAGSVGARGHLMMPTGSSGISVEQAWTALRLDSPAPAMLVAHALAAIVMALGLRRGEQAFLDLAASFRTLVRVLVAVITGRLEPLALRSAALVRGAFDVVQIAGTLLGSDHSGRAPPVVGTR